MVYGIFTFIVSLFFVMFTFTGIIQVLFFIGLHQLIIDTLIVVFTWFNLVFFYTNIQLLYKSMNDISKNINR